MGDTRAMRLHRSQLKRECGAGAGGGPDPPGAGPAARIGGRLAGASGSRGRGSASGEEARPGAGDAAAAAETGSGGRVRASLWQRIATVCATWDREPAVIASARCTVTAASRLESSLRPHGKEAVVPAAAASRAFVRTQSLLLLLRLRPRQNRRPSPLGPQQRQQQQQQQQHPTSLSSLHSTSPAHPRLRPQLNSRTTPCRRLAVTAGAARSAQEKPRGHAHRHDRTPLPRPRAIVNALHHSHGRLHRPSSRRTRRITCYAAPEHLSARDLVSSGHDLSDKQPALSPHDFPADGRRFWRIAHHSSALLRVE